jgi:hypothetical protein
VTLRASHLWYSHYSEYQELLYQIIKQKHESSMGYRKIAQWLNENETVIKFYDELGYAEETVYYCGKRLIEDQ